MPRVLGIDSSTQSTKVELRDAESGTLLAEGRAPHPATSPPRSEQDPEAWWRALAAALAAAGVREVDALSVAAQQHGLVVLGGDDRPLRAAKLWNDTESAPDAEALVAALGPAAWAHACGSVPVPSFTVTKLAWLRRVEPALFARVARIALPHDWLTLRLAGAFVTDRGDASGTGYWSPAEGRYADTLLAQVGGPDGDTALPEPGGGRAAANRGLERGARALEPRAAREWCAMLPTVLGPTEAAGRLRPDAAGALGLAPGALVAAGTGDNMAAALGLALAPGDVALSLGTSGTVYTVAERATADPSGAVAGFADATGRFLPLVCTLNATRVTDTVARLLGLDRDAFDAAACAAPAGAGGLVLVPYLDGERTPNRPHATGTLAGLRTDTTREAVARAAVEGVVCGLLEGLDRLAEALAAAGAPLRADGRLLLLGGGARSPAYRHVVADLAGREVTVPGGSEHVAAGACVQAAAALLGKPPAEVAAAWSLGDAAHVLPDARVDAAAIRSRHAAARVNT